MKEWKLSHIDDDIVLELIKRGGFDDDLADEPFMHMLRHLDTQPSYEFIEFMQSDVPFGCDTLQCFDDVLQVYLLDFGPLSNNLFFCG